MLEEAELPDVLREALHAARERMDERRARRARGDDGSGGGGVAEGDDAGDEDLEGVEEFDVADLIAMEFGGEDDDEEEDDPDYMPSADEDMASDHLVTRHFCSALLEKISCMCCSGEAHASLHVDTI